MQKLSGTSRVIYTAEDGGYVDEPASLVSFVEYYGQNYWVIDLPNIRRGYDGDRTLLCVKEETLKEV